MRSAPITVVNSVNPYRIEGQKTGAFEIVDVLGDAPDYLCIPVGNAGNITAYWKGFLEYKAAGRRRRLPQMLGFQAAGAAPIVVGHPIEKPETIATAIRIGNPASWYGATAAASESGGSITAVTDEEILAAYRFLAAEESVFCEPASAASVAGLVKMRCRRRARRWSACSPATGSRTRQRSRRVPPHRCRRRARSPPCAENSTSETFASRGEAGTRAVCGSGASRARASDNVCHAPTGR